MQQPPLPFPQLPWNARGGGGQGVRRRCGGGYKLHPLLLQPCAAPPYLRSGVAAARGARSSLRTAASDYCVWNDYGSAVWGRGVARSRTSLRLARWQLQKAGGARGRRDYALRSASMSEAGARPLSRDAVPRRLSPRETVWIYDRARVFTLLFTEAGLDRAASAARDNGKRRARFSTLRRWSELDDKFRLLSLYCTGRSCQWNIALPVSLPAFRITYARAAGRIFFVLCIAVFK